MKLKYDKLLLKLCFQVRPAALHHGGARPSDVSGVGELDPRSSTVDPRSSTVDPRGLELDPRSSTVDPYSGRRPSEYAHGPSEAHPVVGADPGGHTVGRCWLTPGSHN